MAVLKGPVWSNYHKLNLSKQATKGIQYGLDARRATIFFRRLRAGHLPYLDFVNEEPDVAPQPEIDTWRAEHQKPDTTVMPPNTSDHSAWSNNPTDEIVEDYVAIIDIDANGPNNGYETIKLPAIPKELDWQSESTFASIKPIGRNTALYHYTGGEDKLQFEIDWYGTTWDQAEVIKNCRKIESLTKADGYQGNPHRVLLKWGDGDILFSGIYFQVLSAPYKLNRFNKAYRMNDGRSTRAHMLPVQAYQTVTLARIDQKNITKKQIEYVNQFSSNYLR